MKYLHLFHNSEFTEPYIRFVNKNFNNKDHFFLVIGEGQKNKYDAYENVFKLTKDLKSFFLLVKSMYQYKKLLLHSLFFKKVVLLLFIQPWLLKKCNWIVWGADLYHYKKRKRKIKSNLYEFIRAKVIKNFNEISTLVKGDYDLAKKWYHVKGTYHRAIYSNIDRNTYLKEISNKCLNNHQEIVIQIGNSATPSNNHLEVFKLIEKYKNENIKIFCPLSYGNANYAKEVINQGKKMFGEKFIAIETYMNFYEYVDFLSGIDIGIFNNNRQQALGNITPLLFLGKKLYMRNETSMWDELSNNLKLFDIHKISNEDFSQFVKMKETDRMKNKKEIEPRFNDDYIIEVWNLIFH